MSTTPHLTSTVYKRALEFAAVPLDIPAPLGVTPVKAVLPPVAAVCTARFHAALPPLICCTSDDMWLTDFLVFNSATCRNSITMSFVFALSVQIPFRHGAQIAPELRSLVDSLRRAPLPVLRRFDVTAYSQDEDELARELAPLLAALPRGLRVLGIHATYSGTLTADFLRELDQQLPNLEELHAVALWVEEGACRHSVEATPGRHQRERTESNRQRWFPHLHTLSVGWRTIHDAFSVIDSDSGTAPPNLRHVRLDVSNLRGIMQPLAFPRAEKLLSVSFLLSCAKIASIDLSGLTQLVEFGEWCFKQLSHMNTGSGNARIDDGFCGLRNDGVLDLTAFVNVRNIGSRFCGMSDFRVLRLPPLVQQIDAEFLKSSNLERVDGSLQHVELIETYGMCARTKHLLDVDFLTTLRPGSLRNNAVSSDCLTYCTVLQRIDLCWLRGATEIGNWFLDSCSSLRTITSADALQHVRLIGFDFCANTPALKLDPTSNDYSLDAPLHVVFQSLEELHGGAFRDSNNGQPVDLTQLPRLSRYGGTRMHATRLLLPAAVEFSDDESESASNDDGGGGGGDAGENPTSRLLS